MRDIFIFGGGKWGSALGYAFSYKNKVFMLSRRELNIDTIRGDNNAYSNEKVGSVKQIDYSEFSQYYRDSKNPLCIIAIASAFLREFLQTYLSSLMLPSMDIKVMVASKGIEQDSGAFPNEILESFFPASNLCYLSGPSFASEVMAGLPCALAIHSSSESLGKEYAMCFPNFIRIYVKSDVIGAEIAGAYKNVIAIGGGICDGLALGNNAKASLLARGLVEMARFGAHFGAKLETFLGLSGSGDLFLTSNSTMSRNYRVGLALSKGRSLQDILHELGEVAEGVYSAKSITQISRKANIHTPIACVVQDIIDGAPALLCVDRLLKRDS